MLRSDYCSDYERQKSVILNFIATIVATKKKTKMQTKELFAFWKGGATKRMRDDFLMRSIKSRREAAQSATTRASIAFWYQNAACRENPDPNAACGRRTNG